MPRWHSQIEAQFIETRAIVGTTSARSALTGTLPLRRSTTMANDAPIPVDAPMIISHGELQDLLAWEAFEERAKIVDLVQLRYRLFH
jgi:hypothetical protein